MATRVQFLERVRREMGKTRGLFPATVAPRPARPAEAAEAVRRQLAERWPPALERFQVPPRDSGLLRDSVEREPARFTRPPQPLAEAGFAVRLVR